MEENLEKARFEVVVPYNNEVLVAARKKSKIIQGVLWIVLALMFAGIAIGSATSTASSTIIIVFGCVAALFVGLAIFSFVSIRTSSKNDDRTVKYDFYEEYIQIHNEKESNNKSKLLKSFLYRNYSNKQYLDSVLEYSDRLVLKIYTGTYNGVPQYQTQIVPVSVFTTDSDLNDFKTFLQKKIGNDYKIKNK